ncbi:DUF1295 domain-containing protein [uncultured Paraglaciecola sp.]|uniref:DUF1295 domain-containing protein n=1 Tax=uncultured Paraglaciecola sp. TaxID=1765024 RepID=UPI00260DAC1F|nr:DUF1295 domain-containing protein [uncultured Paraglaciecola sp.]
MQYIRTLIFYFIALCLATLMVCSGSDGGKIMAVNDSLSLSVFAGSSLIIFAMQWLAFIPAYLFKTEHFYDLTGSITYISVVIFAALQSPPLDIRSIILVCLIGVWAARLGSFLFLRVVKQGSDSRFDEIKHNFWRFSITWTLQGLWVLMTAGAAFAAITSGHQREFGIMGSVGLIVWSIGFAYEVIADNQKQQFRKQNNSNTDFIQTGLWSRSRHPNYFGEILVWLGVAIIAYPALYQWQLITLISPIFVAFLLIRVSGVPQQQKQAEQRWKDNQNYQEYKASTPVLIPKLFK